MFGAGVNRWKPDGPGGGPFLPLSWPGRRFFLPFVLARVFRPTFLEVFGLTNFQLGTAFALYGVVAMLSYFPGGVLADLLSPRKLLALALVATSGGGLLLASIPSLSSLKLLYAYWGFTTVALFWAALMRATRVWGGLTRQGAAFGLLDGGRGLLTAATAVVLVLVYASLIPEEAGSATLEQRSAAFRLIIALTAAMTVLAAVPVWFFSRGGPTPSVESDPALNSAGWPGFWPCRPSGSKLSSSFVPMSDSKRPTTFPFMPRTFSAWMRLKLPSSARYHCGSVRSPLSPPVIWRTVSVPG